MDLSKLISDLERTADELHALCRYGHSDLCSELDIADAVEALSLDAARLGCPVPPERATMTPREGLSRIGQLLAWARENRDLPALLSDREVANLLNVSTRTVWRRVSAKELPQPLKVGGLTRWRRAEIEAHLGV